MAEQDAHIRPRVRSIPALRDARLSAIHLPPALIATADAESFLCMMREGVGTIDRVAWGPPLGRMLLMLGEMAP